MLNKIFIYLINFIMYKLNKNIFLMLFYYLYFSIFHMKIRINDHGFNFLLMVYA